MKAGQPRFSGGVVPGAMRRIIAMLLTLATLAAPAAAARYDPDAELAKILDGRVAGKRVSCLSPVVLQNSRIVAGRAIVYRSGATLYVNYPRSGAETLRRDDILFTRIDGGQLCSIDTIQLLDQTSRFPRGFVTLGDFVPYTRPRAR